MSLNFRHVFALINSQFLQSGALLTHQDYDAHPVWQFHGILPWLGMAGKWFVFSSKFP
jgi:hypothetical protein